MNPGPRGPKPRILARLDDGPAPGPLHMLPGGNKGILGEPLKAGSGPAYFLGGPGRVLRVSEGAVSPGRLHP